MKSSHARSAATATLFSQTLKKLTTNCFFAPVTLLLIKPIQMLLKPLKNNICQKNEAVAAEMRPPPRPFCSHSNTFFANLQKTNSKFILFCASDTFGDQTNKNVAQTLENSRFAKQKEAVARKLRCPHARSAATATPFSQTL